MAVFRNSAVPNSSIPQNPIITVLTYMFNIKIPAFCPHSVFIVVVLILEQREAIYIQHLSTN